jgi:rhomboid protease GluP
MVENIYIADSASARQQRTRLSYQAALNRHRMHRGLARISWVTWSITIVTLALWCFTAYQAAVAAGAHNLHDVLLNIASNAITPQDKDNDALTSVLVRYGAKDNHLIVHGRQYWRFITPIFLHANALHVGLNMLNFFVLGVFLERLTGHARFLLIYLVAGVISIIASFYFASQELSVGASGAIFGLVGAYSVFVLMHRRAFRSGGIPALLWLVIVISINLAIGLFIANVDNYAHIGGLLSGCVLGWWFTPLYKVSSTGMLTDMHSLARRWPLALLTILGTVVLAIIALYRIGG